MEYVFTSGLDFVFADIVNAEVLDCAHVYIL